MMPLRGAPMVRQTSNNSDSLGIHGRCSESFRAERNRIARYLLIFNADNFDLDADRFVYVWAIGCNMHCQS